LPMGVRQASTTNTALTLTYLFWLFVALRSCSRKLLSRPP